MKRIIPVIMFFACLSCEKDLDTYGEGSGIYFDGGELYSDTLEVHWGLKDSEEGLWTIPLKVCLFGNTVDYDRKFSIEVDGGSDPVHGAQENVDFRLAAKEYTLAAHSAETLIEVEVLRPDDLKDRPRHFTIRLVENEELRFLYSREEVLYALSEDGEEEEAVGTRTLDYQRVIYMDEDFPMPGWWELDGFPIFGKWSETKAILICDVMDIKRGDWNKSGSDRLPLGYLKFCGRYMHNWLQENPRTDEDGEAMEMGALSQI